jgi:hypothetical protein
MTAYVPETGQDGSKAAVAAGLFGQRDGAVSASWPVRVVTGLIPRNPASDLAEVLALVSASTAVLQMLRFRQAGHCSSPRLTRGNRDLPHGSSLAVTGDALIQGPRLVAGPSGSEWRTRRPS